MPEPLSGPLNRYSVFSRDPKGSALTQRTSKRQRLPIVLTVIVFVAIPVVRSRADALRPDELLLIYNGDDSDSRELAAYYAEQRGVPADRLFALHVEGTKEEIPAVDFSRLIRDPIRRHLEEHDLRDRVRCLVTFYGLPIRVGEWHVSGEYKALKAKWDRQFINALAELEHAVYELDAIATDIPPSGSVQTQRLQPSDNATPVHTSS